jgi:hypothetical protein
MCTPLYITSDEESSLNAITQLKMPRICCSFTEVIYAISHAFCCIKHSLFMKEVSHQELLLRQLSHIENSNTILAYLTLNCDECLLKSHELKDIIRIEKDNCIYNFTCLSDDIYTYVIEIDQEGFHVIHNGTIERSDLYSWINKCECHQSNTDDIFYQKN